MPVIDRARNELGLKLNFGLVAAVLGTAERRLDGKVVGQPTSRQGRSNFGIMSVRPC